MNKTIIFNWKMNPFSLRQAQNYVKLTQKCAEKTKAVAKIIIAPPDIYMTDLIKLGASASAKATAELRFASQNCFWENSGAYTGEISPKMLKSLGVEYVIIGHSERRNLGETDEMINKKISAALRAGLKVVLCVGERKRGLKEAKNYVKKQLQKDIAGVSSFKLQVSSLIVAYEPVWAIDNGNSATSKYALEMIKFIKHFLKAKSYQLLAKVLYGGSVNGKNILDFVKYSEIDGVLVGGASLNPKEVKEIIKKVG